MEFDLFYQGGADNHAIGSGSDHGGLFRCADAEADADGDIGVGTDFGNKFRDVR